jgi:hypothetical protein
MTTTSSNALHNYTAIEQLNEWYQSLHERIAKYFSPKKQAVQQSDPILLAYQAEQDVTPPQIGQLQTSGVKEYLFQQYKRSLNPEENSEKNTRLEESKPQIIKALVNHFEGIYKTGGQSEQPLVFFVRQQLQDPKTRESILNTALDDGPHNLPLLTNIAKTPSSATSTSMATLTQTNSKPLIADLDQWKEKFIAAKDRAIELSDTKLGKIVTSATISLSLKAVFGAAVVGSGVGVVALGAAAIGFGAVKTIIDAKVKGEPFSKKGFAMNAGLYGIGAAIPFAGEIAEAMPELAEKTVAMASSLTGSVASVIGNIKWPFASAPVSAPKAPIVEAELKEPDVEPIIIPEPTPFETALAALGEAPSAQDIKDAAVHEIWNGDREIGLAMMQLAAENGNSQAARDLVDLKNMGFIAEGLADVIEPTAFETAMAALGEAPSAQDIKDAAVHEIWKGDREAGIQMMEMAALAKNPQAIRDLIELKSMGLASNISVEAQILMEVAQGNDVACGATVETCQFADGVSEKMKSFFKNAFSAVSAGNDNASVTTFKDLPKQQFAANLSVK